ncbi:GNAT family N-acetyltransferase [Halobacillus yeomjeoni]|uniref:GNAT family N-acetyltransferase n=1 Tax=Halobacillus yeomjeoni TaxID=311194 RepID=UPI001CD4DACF|nr:GNAT family N-acetyltransferase [Halobacillus yeomjeoni]MCA0984202.1 GNAT family N-acetyltransferase [Halobacillus yeomjeoni]
MIELKDVRKDHLREMYTWELNKELQEKTGVEEPRTYWQFLNSMKAFRRGGKPDLKMKAIELDGELVGKVELFMAVERAFIGIVVSKKRRSGIGSKAMSLFLDDVKRIYPLPRVYAEVYEDNIESLSFFKKNGFYETGEKEKESFRKKERTLLTLVKKM